MDLRKLKTLIDLVSESGVAELEISEGEDRVRIVNAHAVPVSAPQTVMAPTLSSAPVSTQPSVAAPIVAAEIQGTPIPSPMVGTFYRSPSPGAKPFVQVGDHIKVGQPLCIIEAMKLLNEVESEQEGVLKEICVENGEPVEYSQTLFIIE